MTKDDVAMDIMKDMFGDVYLVFHKDVREDIKGKILPHLTDFEAYIRREEYNNARNSG